MESLNEYEEGSERLRRIMEWSIVLAGLGFIGWFGREIFLGPLREVVFGMAHLHYATVIGISCSGLGALFIVLLLRNVAGAIQFNAFGLEFKGASGPIIMWVLCFWALTFAMIKTWDLATPINGATLQSIETQHKETVCLSICSTLMGESSAVMFVLRSVYVGLMLLLDRGCRHQGRTSMEDNHGMECYCCPPADRDLSCFIRVEPALCGGDLNPIYLHRIALGS
jgi:hypothetical protein